MYQVIWTQLAKDTYASVLEYLMDFSLDAAIKLDEKVEKLTELLEEHRFLCPQSENNPLFRRCVISKNNSMIYEVRGRQIFIVAVIDNRAEHLF